MGERYGMTEISAAVDNLFAGDSSHPEIPVIIQSGEGELARGTVLGKVTKGAIAIVAGAENTGDGDADEIVIGQKAKVGVYRLVCILAVVNGGNFSVVDPDGYMMEDLITGEPYDNGHFAVEITGGDVDFVTGDTFTVTVAAGSGKYKAYDDTATDGTDVARVILGRSVDATLTDVKAFAYAGGEFQAAGVTGEDAAGIEDLAARGIFIK